MEPWQRWFRGKGKREGYISGRRGSCEVLSGKGGEGVREGMEEEEGCRAWKLRLIGRLPGGGIRREVGVSNAFGRVEGIRRGGKKEGRKDA